MLGSTESDLERMLFDETAEPKALPLSLLEKITHGFSDELKIGRGGFSVVYKGILDNGAVIAVKRLSGTYIHDKVFQGEIKSLMQVKHKNIVRFLGYCADTTRSLEMYNGTLVMADTQQRLMCFEYLHRGSLEHYIKDTSGGLEWSKRYKIIKGICEGLNYLHENHILHLDLKPANILMDEYMMPKITDFGQSRCFEENQTRVVATNFGGTLGYMAPEFGSREITYKFDLYSLGVMIREILTGKKGYQEVEKILESWSNRLDRSQREQIRVCAEIGIKCTDFNPANRPVSTKHIIDSLLETESSQVIPAHGPSELLVVHQFTFCFPFEPNKVITCQLRLTNNTDRNVAFRVLDRSGESFLRLPLYGIVPPRSPYTLDLTTKEHKELPRKRNMDMILDSATILGDDYIDIFESQPNNYFEAAKEKGSVVQEITLNAFYTPQREMIESSKMVAELHHMSFEHTGSKPHRLTLQHLKDITNNFCNEGILGRGGCSVVYKGMLQSGEVVAVKKLEPAIPNSQEQFENEVNLLMKLKHPNIVRLVGYSYETQHLHTTLEGKIVFAWNTERLLCLEYLPNGSLDKYISDASSGLDWHTRNKIIQGISFGLHYLHEQENGSIIHLDLKPANILLDENMTAKISDFGLSRPSDKNLTIHTLCTSGTLGYMSPEYLRGIITPMTDIFSLGVIILEVITGHRDYPYDIKISSEAFIDLELKKWRNRLQNEPEYTSLEIKCQEIKRCIQIGLICVNPERSKRPTMKKIIDMLQGMESMDWYITNEVTSPAAHIRDNARVLSPTLESTKHYIKFQYLYLESE